MLYKDPRPQQEYKSDDPIRQGFFDSTFFKPNAISTADMANYTYNGKSMQGSSSQIGQFGNYLDSIGKGDLLQRQGNSFAQQPGIGGLLRSAPGEDPFRIRSIEERKQIAEEMNNSGGGPMKNDGTRAIVTEEQVGSGKNTMPSIPFKPGVLNPQQPGGAGQTLTGQPLVQQVQSSLINKAYKSPEYLAWANTVMQTGGYPTEENPGEMGTIKSLESLPIFSGIGSLIPTPQQPGLGDLLGSGNENSFTPQQPVMPTSPYQEQLTGFGEQLTGFGNQLTGFNDQFGGFNDQFGGFNNQFKGLDKQFDMINTRLNSVDEGIASLSKQSQPQQQSYNSPYPNFNFRTNSYSNSSPFGLSSLFMGRY